MLSRLQYTVHVWFVPLTSLFRFLNAAVSGCRAVSLVLCPKVVRESKTISLRTWGSAYVRCLHAVDFGRRVLLLFTARRYYSWFLHLPLSPWPGSTCRGTSS